ncbi:MAG: hypothetical protein QOE93_829, partial [Actinomycetota bacterium]|nr:hypothetical protein [Actinomycetota bacterium]
MRAADGDAKGAGTGVGRIRGISTSTQATARGSPPARATMRP